MGGPVLPFDGALLRRRPIQTGSGLPRSATTARFLARYVPPMRPTARTLVPAAAILALLVAVLLWRDAAPSEDEHAAAPAARPTPPRVAKTFHPGARTPVPRVTRTGAAPPPAPVAAAEGEATGPSTGAGAGGASGPAVSGVAPRHGPRSGPA